MSLEVAILPFNQLQPIELYAALKLRQDVFMLEQACLFADLDNRDQEAWHSIGRFEQNMVAYTRIFEPDVYYPGYCSIGRVVSSPTHRHQGFGRQIMEASLAFCASTWPQASIKIGAQQYLEDFYQSLGFISTPTRYIEDGIPHVYMTLDR